MKAPTVLYGEDRENPEMAHLRYTSAWGGPASSGDAEHDSEAMTKKLIALGRFEEDSKHASWCNRNELPSWRHKSLGGNFSTTVCNCALNPVAKSLRKLAHKAPVTRAVAPGTTVVKGKKIRKATTPPFPRRDALVAALELMLARLTA